MINNKVKQLIFTAISVIVVCCFFLNCKKTISPEEPQLTPTATPHPWAGQIYQYKCYNGIDTLTCQYHYENFVINSGGNVESKSYIDDSTGQLTFDYVYEYDVNTKQLIRETWYNNPLHSSYQQYQTYIYDIDGSVSTKTVYTSSGIKSSTTHTIYNSNKKTEDYKYDATDTLTEIEKYYYDSVNLTVSAKYWPSGLAKGPFTTYEYDTSNRLIYLKERDTAGNCLSCKSISYDSHGRETIRTSFSNCCVTISGRTTTTYY